MSAMTPEDLRRMYDECTRATRYMLDIGALYGAWAVSDGPEDRRRGRELIGQILSEALARDDRGSEISAMVISAMALVDTMDEFLEQRVEGKVRDMLVDALAACMLGAMDRGLSGEEV